MEKTVYIKANSVAFSGHRTIAENYKDEIRKKLRGKIRLLYAMGLYQFLLWYGSWIRYVGCRRGYFFESGTAQA